MFSSIAEAHNLLTRSQWHRRAYLKKAIVCLRAHVLAPISSQSFTSLFLFTLGFTLVVISFIPYSLPFFIHSLFHFTFLYHTTVILQASTIRIPPRSQIRQLCLLHFRPPLPLLIPPYTSLKMQLHSTFGAFLVAFTLVQSAPLLVERHPARAGNMTANANSSGPGSNFRAGGNGFRPGMMQGMENDGPSVDVNAGDDGSNEGESAKRSEGIKGGASGTSGTASSIKRQKKAPAGGKLISGTAITDAPGSSIQDLIGRDQGPTQQGRANDSPEGGNTGSTGKPNGGTSSGPSRTSGNRGSGGSTNGSPQPPAEGAPFKRDTTSTGRTAKKVGSQNQKVDTNPNGLTTTNPKNTPQGAGQTTSGQTSSTGSSTEGVADTQKATTRAAAEDKVEEPPTIKSRAEKKAKPLPLASGGLLGLNGLLGSPAAIGTAQAPKQPPSD